MDNFDLPDSILDKIYEIKTNENNQITKLISYFPLIDDEKNQVIQKLGNKFTSGTFHSIFSDVVSDEEWQKSKTQIKERFQKELFDID